MGSTDQAIADLITEYGLDLMRMEAGTRAKVIEILNRMQRELLGRLASEDLTAFSKARMQALLQDCNAVMGRYYTMAQGELDLTANGVAEITAGHTATAMETVIVGMVATLPTQTFMERLASNLLIQGAPSSAWWSRQELDTAFKFAAEVRQGVAQGESNEQIVARIAGSPRKGIAGVMDIARSNARSLVQTSIQSVANASHLETYQRNADVIDSLVWLSTLDSHTCIRCASRDQKRYDLKTQEPIGHDVPWSSGPGRIHWSCRCATSIKTKSFKDLGIDMPEVAPGQRASNEGPVAAGTDFQSFLDRKGKSFADDVLGPGRADLYREKKLTLLDLISGDGRPLTLAQLRKKYQ